MSKVVMSIAAISLIVLSLIFFSSFVKEDQLVINELDDISVKIAQTVNQALSFPGEIRYNVTYQENMSTRGLWLPIHVNGKDYDLFFTTGSISISQNSDRETSRFNGPLHLWGPDSIPEKDITSEELRKLDSRHAFTELCSGSDFVVENIERIVDGKHVYLTLLYEVISIR